ncbi:MAG: hypothetical protein WBA74_19425 [Cyclobacteriaceae bacterium]
MKKLIFTAMIATGIITYSCDDSSEYAEIVESPSSHQGCGAGTGSDCTYPNYSTEFLQPFRDNFGSTTTLPAAHLRFVDQATGQPIANQVFSVERLSDGAEPGNTTITDADGFWYDEDFQADPGAGTYEITICDEHFYFVYDGINPSINLFETNDCELPLTPNFWNFDGIPQSILDEARSTYGNVAPAVTIAFTYNNSTLQQNWSFGIFSSPQQGCFPGEGGDYEVQGQYQGGTSYQAIDGFVFFEADEMCGNGTYQIDNRQGGWFDYVCGPQGKSFNYQGESIFVLVNLWCE